MTEPNPLRTLSTDDALRYAAELLDNLRQQHQLGETEPDAAVARSFLAYVAVHDQRAAVAAAQAVSDRGYALQRQMAMPLTEAVSLVEELAAADFDGVTGSTLRDWISRAKELNAP